MSRELSKHQYQQSKILEQTEFEASEKLQQSSAFSSVSIKHTATNLNSGL